MSSRNRGRIHSAQRRRNYDNNDDINTDENNAHDIRILPEHTAGIAVTVNHAEKEATRNGHRNRLKRMVNFCYQSYAADVPKIIRPVTADELSDPTKHFHKQTEDFIYSKLPPDVIMAFLSTVTKDEKTGKTRSYTHIRKFYDAILFGAREQRVSLPSKPLDFHVTVENYLKSFRNENVAAKKRGDVEEIDADPMPFALYVALCTWFVESGDIFSWCYLVILWNCMGRSASVDPLGLHNLKLGTDSIVITYDDSKMDSSGERVHPKNCYANPYCPSISMFLALGVYFMLYPEQYESTDCLFLKERTVIGTATKRFAARLRTLVSHHCEEIRTWAVPERIKGHSGRKGTATYVTAATLNPPPLSSVAHRGEWSQGKVQDIYFNFAQPGDHYL